MENFDQILDFSSQEKRSLEYAGFWVRVTASIIDWLITIIPSFFITIFIPILSFPLLIIGWALYCSLLESSAHQATVGKMALGLKVTDVDGDRLTFGNALGRHFAKYLSTMVIFAGFIMAGWDSRKQTLHDKAADTVVIQGKSSMGF